MKKSKSNIQDGLIIKNNATAYVKSRNRGRVLNICFIFLLFVGVSNPSWAKISSHNTVDWIILAKSTVNQSHLIQFNEPLNDENDCVQSGSGGKPRIRLEKEETDILSLFMAAKLSGSTVRFYFETTTDLPGMGGHGSSECEFRNVWIMD